MKYLKDAQKILSSYTEDNEETLFDILHLYPKTLCKNSGINNYRFFEVIGFNKANRTKRNLHTHDEMRLNNVNKPEAFKQIAIFADGSTLLLLSQPYQMIFEYQTLYIKIK